MEWDILDLLENNTTTFIVKKLPHDKLLYALSVVYHYINQYNIEDGKDYDLLCYAEPIKKFNKNEYIIFTSLPYLRFQLEEPNFKFERKNTTKNMNRKNPKKNRKTI